MDRKDILQKMTNSQKRLLESDKWIEISEETFEFFS